MRRLIKLLTLLCVIAGGVLPSMAVTQKEMEQARTITAFWYLRYANNGAGYMEDAKMPTTMAELEKILKETERNNLKAFKAVSVPSDYSGWDKNKLVAYWGDTFFSSAGLSDQGKAARSRVKGKLNAMTVADPKKEEPEKPAVTAEDKTEETKPVEELPAEKANTASAQPEPADEMASAAQVIAEVEKQDSAVSVAAVAADEPAHNSKSASSSTWIYIIALIILVGVVIWLVIFASKTMQDNDDRSAAKARKDGLSESETQRLLLRQASVADESSELRARDREIRGLREECVRLSEENTRLESQLSEARKEIESLRGRINAVATVASAEVAKPKATPEKNVERKGLVENVKSAMAAPKEEVTETKSREIYLGRVNLKGLFVRADRKPVAEKSVFVLSTSDGYTGTYRIIQNAEVIGRCLDNPDHYLAGGCTAPDILATEDAEQIRTLKPGTAIFEDGCWRMVRKTKIVYE